MSDTQSAINNNWEPVIGLEVHVELNTKTKMFCRCSADYFGAKPNTHTCPVCLGLPGALPFINEEAIEKCMKIGLALGCTIAEKSLFERKNYFYPDLPKGYQISQYRWPLCVNGQIEVEGKNGKRTIRINRAHQEEDTGKLSHRGNETFIDFNRSGLPLVEIVTEADFMDSQEIRDYGKKLQQIIRSIGVSEADLEKGNMRLEANISVRPKGQKKLPNYRVELKNINSFKFVADATDIEIKRQTAILESGGTISLQTRGYNEDKRETFLQRQKEEANDYRYFPEPDLPQLIPDRSLVQKLENEIENFHPEKRIKHLAETYSISPEVAKILFSQGMGEYFQEAAKLAEKSNIPAIAIANYIANKKVDTSSTSPQMLIQKLQYQTSDTTSLKDLEAAVIGVISENEKIAGDYKSGNVNAIQVLVGLVMKKTQGKADPKKTRELLEKQLS